MSLGRAALAAYRLGGWAAAPLAPRHLAARAARGKEDSARMDEKRGRPSRASGGRPVWIHAVSVGEAGVAMTLAGALRADGHEILITTSTPASAERVAASPFPHQYAPLDAPPFVDRFLAHWRPLVGLFVEAEVWPTTLHRLAAAKIARVHVNARLSARSFGRWSRLLPVARALFPLIDLALCQSAADAARFAALGTQAVETGNIKFDAPAPVADPAAVAALREALGDRPVWLAASLHPGETAAVANAHRTIVAACPRAVTIAMPRHMATAEALAADGAELATARRSAGDPIADGTFYIADTFGEMGTFLALAPVVFLGGSLVPLGGHNPAEPAAFGAELLTGPSHGPMFAPFLASGAAVVADGAALGEAVLSRLSDGGPRGASRQTLAAQRGALDRTLLHLRPILARARAAA
ncbi:MAG: glycosyltransferase N-terminal domain-containing protein [Pseudomonadota bacterium]